MLIGFIRNLLQELANNFNAFFEQSWIRTKAFYTLNKSILKVDHGILQDQCKEYGLERPVFMLFHPNLIHRVQFV